MIIIFASLMLLPVHSWWTRLCGFCYQGLISWPLDDSNTWLINTYILDATVLKDFSGAFMYFIFIFWDFIFNVRFSISDNGHWVTLSIITFIRMKNESNSLNKYISNFSLQESNKIKFEFDTKPKVLMTQDVLTPKIFY